MKSLTAPIIKSIIFIVVTVVATALLALTITDGTSNGDKTYSAVFSDATLVNPGDDIRMAGVRIGKVDSVETLGRTNTKAKITFSLPADRRLSPTVTATLRYRNLIGQRYVSLDQGSGSLDRPLAAYATIPLSRTSPALDLTALFNGFQPLFQALDPKQINALSAEIIAVFQGEGPTIDSLLSQAGELTKTIADKDQVIGRVIENLNAVLDVVNDRGEQLGTLVSSLRQLVSGLAADRGAIGSAVQGISGLTTDVADLLQQGRAPLKSSIVSLGQVSKNLAGSAGTLNSFFDQLPVKLTKIGRTASYGSWINFYVCSIGGRIPVPDGYGDVKTTQYPAPPGVPAYPTVPVSGTAGEPNPAGLVGVDNVATARCNA